MLHSFGNGCKAQNSTILSPYFTPYTYRQTHLNTYILYTCVLTKRLRTLQVCKIARGITYLTRNPLRRYGVWKYKWVIYVYKINIGIFLFHTVFHISQGRQRGPSFKTFRFQLSTQLLKNYVLSGGTQRCLVTRAIK